jgi:hypothetical protein
MPAGAAKSGEQPLPNTKYQALESKYKKINFLRRALK